MRTTSDFLPEQLNLRVTQAYASLFLAPKREDGSKVALIARLGAFEVLLVEMPSPNVADTSRIWIELRGRDDQITIDSCGCDDLERAIFAAEDFVSQAIQRNRDSDADRNLTASCNFETPEPKPVRALRFPTRFH